MRHRNRIVAAGVLVLIAVGAALYVGVLRHSSSRRDANEPNGAAVQEAEAEGEFDADREDGYFNPRKEAKFEGSTGEADREGPENPAAEQVQNRAFPRNYVNDKRAVAERKNFTKKPTKPDRSAFNSAAAFNEALSAAPGAWTALGPVTGDVPGESG